MRYQSYKALSIGIENRVATVVMNRPDTLNAIDEGMHAELAHIFIDLNEDPKVDVIILTGAGRAFSSGGDIRWMQAMIDEPARFEKQRAKASKSCFRSLIVKSRLSPK